MPKNIDINTTIQDRYFGLLPISLRLARLTAPKAMAERRKMAILAVIIVQ